MRTILNVFLVLGLLACKTQKEAVTTAPIPVAPAWVQQKPITSTYYIGIGSATKNSGTQYLNTAKENALSDLASEIKVNVNSNSLLYSLEQKGRFEQEYKESIRTSSDANLEGFELVDVWEDDDQYYTYYRLDKMVYAEMQRKRKEAAQKQSLDFYHKGEQAASEGNYQNAVQFYLQGLQSIEGFWSEENEVSIADGSTLLLDNELYAKLNSLVTGVQISTSTAIVRNYENGFSPKANIVVKNNSTQRAYSGVPLYYSYPLTDGKYSGKATTGNNGSCNISITGTPSNRDLVLNMKVDVDELFDAFTRDPFMRELLKNFEGAKSDIPMSYNPATIWISSSEKNLDNDMNPFILTSAIKSSLAAKGVHIVDSASKADVKLTLSANTKARGESQGFASTFLNFDIEIRDAKTGASVFNVSKSNVKGVDMNFEKAGIKAYRNLSRNLDSEIISKLKNKIY